MSSRSINIDIEVPTKAHEDVLRSIPPAGLSSSKTLVPRSAFLDLLVDGLVRVDGLGSVHLTTCGLMCLEAMRSREDQENPTGAAA